MSEALNVVSGALWSFLLCFFDVAFFWQRVRQLPFATEWPFWVNYYIFG
jgi:hypothetical protein